MYNRPFGLIQVLGIPWDVDIEGLQDYMGKFGGLDDVIVMRVSLESHRFIEGAWAYNAHSTQIIHIEYMEIILAYAYDLWK